MSELRTQPSTNSSGARDCAFDSVGLDLGGVGGPGDINRPFDCEVARCSQALTYDFRAKPQVTAKREWPDPNKRYGISQLLLTPSYDCESDQRNRVQTNRFSYLEAVVPLRPRQRWKRYLIGPSSFALRLSTQF